MLLRLSGVLSGSELQQAQAMLRAQALWRDGRHSAGGQAAQVKRNQQLAADSEACAALAPLVKQALLRDPVFYSAALPARWSGPHFNRYDDGGACYGAHVDNALLRGSGEDGPWVRGDLSCTLFLSAPEDYDGGELVMREGSRRQSVKLAAGDAVLYPSSSVHEVLPVTRGVRLASFMWLQSLVRDGAQRALLFDLDQRITRLRASLGESEDLVALTSTYHNLLRMWAQT